MKNQLLVTLAFLMAFVSTQAQQWQDDGSVNIRNANPGNVGIGTVNGASLTERLHVAGRVRANGFVSGTQGITSEVSTNLTLGTNGTPQLFLIPSGNLGIGISNPTQKLEVAGNILSTQFISSSGIYNALGDFTVQTNGTPRISVIGTDGSVGIGTTIPNYELDVNGTINGSTILSTGNVGIGTTTPAAKLHLENGDLLINNGTTPTVFLGTGTTELNRYLQIQNTSALPNASGIKAGGLLVADNFGYANPGKNDLVVKGVVSIGTPITTSTNNYTLAVNGTIGAKDLRIEKTSNAWPDYVFEENYDLPTTAELEAYIKVHKHLEGMPSAEEVKANGYSVNELDVALLKKVEELTLLVIQQQKEIEALKKDVELVIGH